MPAHNAWNRLGVRFRDDARGDAHAAESRRRRFAIWTGTLVATIAMLASASGASLPEEVRPVFTALLPNVPGQRLTALLVTYPRGGQSPAHHHAGSVFAYVLSETVRSENLATGPARVYRAGESFFEPPGSRHLISENAITTEAASLLAVFVAEEGGVLKEDDR